MKDMNKIEHDIVSYISNRSLNQSTLLYDLLNSNILDLINLEIQLLNTFTLACPQNIEEINKVLELPTQRNKEFSRIYYQLFY